MKASDLLAKCLENEGVEYIFGVPGEENLDFLNSLKDSDIKVIVTRHEQGAGFMAATYGRLTGKPGVCLATLGPGATNLTTCAAFSQLGAMPMLMITGQKPILGSKQGHFQIVDIVEMMKPLTKYTKQVSNGNRIPSIVRESFRSAICERPGAVHIELPEDIAAESTNNHPIQISERKLRRPIPHEKAIAVAVQMIENSKRPLICVGNGANRKQITKMLTHFLEKTGIYFVTTQMGKGVIRDDSPQAIGTAALSSGDYVHCAIDAADLIINIGHDVIEKPPFFMEQDGDQKVLHINFDPAEMDEVYFPHFEVIGDIANALWQITESITAQDSWDHSIFQNTRTQVQAKIEEKSDDDNFPVKPQRYVADVRSVMDEEDILSLDNGMYKLWFARNYPALAPNTLLLDNALATMGAGLPGAMMAKILNPDKKVLAVCGDGGFMMNSQEMETAVRLNLDLVVLVLNNSAYGMIKWKQHAQGFTDFGLDFNNPDFVKYAEAYGATGHKITKTDDFKTTLESAFTAGGVHLIDLEVDDSEHAKVLTQELEEKTCSI